MLSARLDDDADLLDKERNILLFDILNLVFYHLEEEFKDLIWSGLVIWHVNNCRLLMQNKSLYI